jgi:hypothetical protein
MKPIMKLYEKFTQQTIVPIWERPKKPTSGQFKNLKNLLYPN